MFQFRRRTVFRETKYGIRLVSQRGVGCAFRTVVHGEVKEQIDSVSGITQESTLCFFISADSVVWIEQLSRDIVCVCMGICVDVCSTDRHTHTHTEWRSSTWWTVGPNECKQVDYVYTCFLYFIDFFCFVFDATAPSGPWSPHSRSF